jgi:ATP-binding cassette subfamily B protein
LSRIDLRFRSALQWVWHRSVARLAELDIAVPKPIALAERGARVGRYLWVAIRAGAPWSSAGMVIATLLGTACNVGQSFILGQVTEQALASQRERVTWLLLALMALWLAGPLLQALHSLARLYASQNLRIVVTDHLTARLMHARPRQVADNAVGNLVERIELASTNLPAVVCTATDTLVKFLSVTVLASLVLAGVSTPMALLAGAWMLTALLLSSYLAYTGMNIVEDASDAHAKVIADLAEIATNVALIRSFTAQAMERRRFGSALQADLYACRRVRSYWVFVLLIETAYKWLFGFVVTFYAVQHYGAGTLPLPQLITICSLVIALSWHFESVAFHFVDLFDALGVLRSGLRELSAIDVDLDHGSLPLPQPGRVVLESVTASYNHVEVLRDVSLQIEPGSKVGIVGPSSSGKSTLLAVLRGDLVPDHGRVELHGVPLADCSVEQLARASSEAVQNALMFNRSVRENVTYGTPEPAPKVIEQALSAAQAWQLVQGLPQGLETMVGERGASLSTGERQRLSIARALLKHTQLVVFDEATSSVDMISEAHIIDHLIDNTLGCTVIVVTHRVATLERFDRIIVMDQGRIIDTGSPQELLSRNTLFQRLRHHEDDLGEQRHLSRFIHRPHMPQVSFPAEPSLLKGATQHWQAHRRWTWDFITSRADDLLVLTDAQGETAGEARLADYMKALRAGEKPLALLYASGWRFFEGHPDMLDDFSEPVQAQPDMLQRIPQHLFKPLLWIFIGPEGSGTDLHYDVLDTHAWLAVIRGRKRIALHPPVLLAADYDRHRAQALTVLRERRDQECWRYVELEPGDLLLIPAGWWHEVVNEGLTLGLTRNFATPDIHERVAQAAHAQGLVSLLRWDEKGREEARR